MNITLDLPKKVSVSDYHEFQEMQDYFSILDKKIKVIEIGFGGTKTRRYQGMIYSGNIVQIENLKLFNEIKNKCLKWEKAFEE